MEIRRAGVGVVAAVGVGLLAMAAAPSARAQVKLEYKFPEGKTLTYKTTMKMNQTMTLMGMEIPTEIEGTVVESEVNGKRAGDATLPVQHRIDSMRNEFSLPGGIQITYDSKDPDFKIDNEQLKFLEDVFKLAGSIGYTVILDARNQVKAVEGTEKLLERADKLNEIVPRLDAVRALGREAQGEVRAVPRQPAGRPGPTGRALGADRDPRHRRRPGFPDAQEVRIRRDRKKGDRTLDKITTRTLEVKIKDDPNDQSPAKVTKSDLKVESSEGTILFDREAGCVVETRGKLHVKGSMTLSAGGQEIPGELDITMETVQELQPGAK